MAHDFAVDPSGNIVINIGYNLGQLAGGIHHETVPVNVSGAVSTLDFASKSVLQFTVTGDLSGSYTLPPSNIPALTQNATRTILAIEYTQDATGGRAIQLETLFANAANSTHMGNPSVDLAAGGKTRVKLVVFRSAGTIFTHAEFLPQHTHANLSVATQHSLTGGGTLAASRTLALVGDTASPGASKYYGTNAGSTRGFYDLPVGGGGGATALGGLTDVADVLAPSNNQVLTYSSSTGLWQAGTVTIPGGSGTVVDTIAALQAIATPVANEYVFVRGYASATGVGGGLFQWNAASTDTQTVTGATIAAGGTGYSVGQLIWPSTGTPASRGSALFKVTTISGGVVTGVAMNRGGVYTVAPTSSAGATGTEGLTGTGLTLNLTIISFSNGITVAKSGGGTGRWVRKIDQAAYWDIKWFGAVGDGATDDTTAIQNAVDLVVPIHFPAGEYVVTKAITWWPERTLNIRGVGIYGSNTSKIIGNIYTDEPVFHPFGRYLKQDGTYQFEFGWELDSNNLGGVACYVHLESIHIQSQGNLYGSCFETALQQDAKFIDCCFEATFRGLTMAQAQFDSLILNCRFMNNFMNFFPWEGTTGGESNKIIARRAWGLYASGHKSILNCSFVGCGTGLYITGIENDVVGIRMEVNNYGIILGTTEYRFGGPTTSVPSRSILHGLSLEANTWGIYIQGANICTLEAIGIQGSPEAPPRPVGEYGVYIEGFGWESRMSNFKVEGDFKYMAIANLSPNAASKYSSSATNAYGGMNTPFLDVGYRPSAHLVSARSPIGSLTFFGDFRQEGLNQLDLRTASPSARNLGGRVTVAQGAQTSAVTFQEQVGISVIAFSSITAVNDGASTLPAGTYYYATTVVSWNGEVGVMYNNATLFNHRSIVVGSGQRVDMQFYSPPGTASKYVRRVYKANEIGRFLGYWQLAIGANFSDTGSVPYTAMGMPPPDGNLPNTNEDDANYHINLTAQGWNAGNVWVTNKTTTGFTINCSTVAPSGGGQISWLMYRA